MWSLVLVGIGILIEDLKGLETGKTLSVDICVVGAGPAGITIANEFIGSGLRVCLVESGGLSDEEETQALYQGENVGHPVVMDEGRYRLFGGAATRWGGRCAILDRTGRYCLGLAEFGSAASAIRLGKGIPQQAQC
jgi:choline dehydrogenase-like flavoprotein